MRLAYRQAEMTTPIFGGLHTATAEIADVGLVTGPPGLALSRHLAIGRVDTSIGIVYGTKAICLRTKDKKGKRSGCPADVCLTTQARSITSLSNSVIIGWSTKTKTEGL